MTHDTLPEDNDIQTNINIPRGRGRPPGAKNKPKVEPVDASHGVAAEELKQFVERIERLEEEKKALSHDVKDVFVELKGRGFDVKAVRYILRARKRDYAERAEMNAIVELYAEALGMQL